jgi:hypothetical protein
MTLESTVVILRYPSLVQWFADCLAHAVTQLNRTKTANETNSDSTEQTISIPRFTLDAKQFGTLASPLPLKLAHQHQAQPETIGSVLIEHIQQRAQPAWLLPSLWIHPQGWLYAQFSALALSQWLQVMLESPSPVLEPIPLNPVSGISTDPCWFQIQYVHARCCSLLCLAQTQQILPGTALNRDDAKILFPQLIPWLTASHQWRLQNPAEKQILTLLWQLPQLWTSQPFLRGNVLPHRGQETSLTTTLSWPLPDTLLRRQTATWSEAFLHFYSECRFFTVDPTPDPLALSQARLALVFLVQRATAFWLETLLQIEAPGSL